MNVFHRSSTGEPVTDPTGGDLTAFSPVLPRYHERNHLGQ